MKDALFSSYSIPAPESFKRKLPSGRRLFDWLQGYISKLKSWQILFLPMGFLLGRASLVGEIAPFGAIFWLLILRERPRESYMLAGAVLLGGITTHGWSVTSLLAFSMFLVWFWEALFLRYRNHKSPLVLSSLLIVITGNPIIFHHLAISYEEMLITGLKITVGILAAYALLPAIQITKKLPFIRDRPQLSSDEAMAMVLLLSLVLMGTSQLEIAGLNLMHMLSKMVLLLGAYLAGAAWGAAVGIITGTILGLGNPQIYMIIGSLSFSGFWAGYMRQFGKWGSGLAYILSVPVISIVSATNVPIFGGAEDLVVLGVFVLVPTKYWNKVGSYLPSELRINDGLKLKEGGSCNYLYTKTEQLAEFFHEMSASFSIENMENNNDIIDEIAMRCCEPCLLYKKCWGQELESNSQAIIEIVSSKGGSLNWDELPGGIKTRCPRTNRLLETIKWSKELWELNNYWQERLKEGKELVAYQLKGASELVQDISREVKDTYIDIEELEPPVYTLEIGIAQSPVREEEVCGDYYACSEISINQQAIIISDGMGSGPAAFLESKTTVSLLERMVRLGFSKEVIIKILNSMLQLRNPEEVFATVDLTIINLAKGEVEWVKVGGAPSYCKRGAQVKKYGSGSLPLGILSDLELDLEHHFEKLQPHDILVMVSDGVLAASGDWIPTFLSQYEFPQAQAIADRLMEEATRRNEEADDKTIVVCRLIPLKNGS